jgi:pimeloyl-ACP methyl ester carboxylesterase
MRAGTTTRTAAGLLILGIGLAGCGGSSAPTTTTKPTTAPPPATSAPSVAPTTEPSPFGTRPELPLDPRNKGSKVVSFPSTDGLTMTGRLYGSGPHGVVLAPSGNVRYTQFEWLAVAPKLAKAGYHVLTFNVRGICYTPDPNVGCSEGDIDWANAWKDVAAAVEFLRSQGATTVSVMGADLGGTEALYANSQGTEMDGIVTVSGLEESEGYLIDSSVLDKVDAPMLFIAGSGDDEAAQAYHDWLRETPAPKKGILLDTSDRGTFIFDPLAPANVPLAKKTLGQVEQFLQSVA